MSITGEPDGEPQKVGVALVDVITGLFATVGILAALRHRDATGEGQRVDVDLLSACSPRSSTRAPRTRPAEWCRGGWATRHPSIAPYELLPAADGDLVLAVGNDRQFAALCEVLGAPGLAGDERFATNADRVAHRDALRDRARAAPIATSDRSMDRGAYRGRCPGGRGQRHRRGVRARREARPRADRRGAGREGPHSVGCPATRSDSPRRRRTIAPLRLRCRQSVLQPTNWG